VGDDAASAHSAAKQSETLRDRPHRLHDHDAPRQSAPNEGRLAMNERGKQGGLFRW
jgi:hypothetical protein